MFFSVKCLTLYKNKIDMAINNAYVNITPDISVGEQIFKISGKKVNNGRSPRNVIVRWVAKNAVRSKSLVIEQEGRPSFVEVPDTVLVPNQGGTMVIRGKSNARHLILTVKHAGNLNLDLSGAVFKVNTKVWDMSKPIDGDIGFFDMYDWSLEVEIPKNETETERTASILVSWDGQSKDIFISQQKKEALIISVTPKTLEMDKLGNEVSFIVNANGPWSIVPVSWEGTYNEITFVPTSGTGTGNEVVRVTSTKAEGTPRQVTVVVRIDDTLKDELVLKQAANRSRFITSKEKDFDPQGSTGMLVVGS